MKPARWTYVNTLVTWAIGTIGFFVSQWGKMSTAASIAIVVLCLLLALLANAAIEAHRARRTR